MNKVLTPALALVAAVVLQMALAPQLAVFGVVPNFIFLVVVTLALVKGPVAGGVSGFVGGLLFDLLGTSVVGPYALVLTLVGYLAGMLTANMFAVGWLLPVTVVAVASLSTEIVYGIVLSVIGAGTPFWSAFLTKILPSALYHTVLVVLAYPWLARVLRPEQQIKSFRRLA